MKKKHLIQIALQQKCKCECDYYLNRIKRVWYTFKVICCIVLGLRGDLWAQDAICVAEENTRKDYRGAIYWDQLMVGYSDWTYDYFENSNM
jgi:hypothetical protein